MTTTVKIHVNGRYRAIVQEDGRDLRTVVEGNYDGTTNPGGEYHITCGHPAVKTVRLLEESLDGYGISKETTAALRGIEADILIANEVQLQDRMWGIANERADVQLGQMIEAATASCVLVQTRNEIGRDAEPRHLDKRGTVEGIVEEIRDVIYPRDWSGFRDYGSDVANLVVAAAYLRQEIKRRLTLGEDTFRSSRKPDQPYAPETKPAFTTADPDWRLKAGRL